MPLQHQYKTITKVLHGKVVVRLWYGYTTDIRTTKTIIDKTNDDR